MRMGCSDELGARLRIGGGDTSAACATCVPLAVSLLETLASEEARKRPRIAYERYHVTPWSGGCLSTCAVGACAPGVYFPPRSDWRPGC